MKTIRTTVVRMSPRNRILFIIAVIAAAILGLWLWYAGNSALSREVPVHAGTLNEGMIGSPRFINPVLAASNTDKALVSLIYSGLLRPAANNTGTTTASSSESGYLPNLAESWSLSDDGLIYTVTLRPDAVFQDGTPVTADDVVFTVEKIQDPLLRSPLQARWQDVTVEKVSDRVVRFVLRDPYPGFLAYLTLGILPSHVWQSVGTDEFAFSTYNTHPIGSGPYELTGSIQNDDGFFTQVSLSAFKRYAQGEPYITHMNFTFYPDVSSLAAAFDSNNIESAAGLPADNLKESKEQVYAFPTSRIFAVFLNQNADPVLAHDEVREALAQAVDRAGLIGTIFEGYADPVTRPIAHTEAAPDTAATTTAAERQNAAIKALTDAGWQKNEKTGIMELTTGGKTQQLAFTLSTSDASELKAVAQFLQKEWKAIGADVAIETHTVSELEEDIIRPRAYDALLFGEVVDSPYDLYSFWHSSRRNDPGLNVAGYASQSADALLEAIRESSDVGIRKQKLEQFETLIATDVPAIFLYSPDILYAAPQQLRGVSLHPIADLSERFEGVAGWYLHTQRIWKFIQPQTTK